jgi:dihydrofolate reductase
MGPAAVDRARSLDGLLADEGTEFWKFCFHFPENREPDDPAQLDFLQSAYAHLMGRTAYEAIAAGDTTEEIDKLRLGGDGHIVVWGGVSLWRSLMRLDLIDELRVSLFPYVAGEGTRLFDGVPKSYRLDLVSTTASSSGIVELRYRRHR